MQPRLRSATHSVGKSAVPAPPRGGLASPGAGGRENSASGRGSSGGGGLPTSGSDTFEWDMRKNDGPTDRAFYACDCGHKFTARVATTVSCPNCGAGQAW